jgi:hypothetical protein
MLPYPQIDPVALAIGPLKIHWYGLMYLIGIGGAWLLASRRLNRFDPTWTKEKLSDMVFWMSMGVIVGGRLGYVLFYDLRLPRQPDADFRSVEGRHVVPWRLHRSDAGGVVVRQEEQQVVFPADGFCRTDGADRLGRRAHW